MYKLYELLVLSSRSLEWHCTAVKVNHSPASASYIWNAFGNSISSIAALLLQSTSTYAATCSYHGRVISFLSFSFDAVVGPLDVLFHHFFRPSSLEGLLFYLRR